MNNDFPTWPHFSERERRAVDEVLRSGKVNYWTGEQGGLFEREFAAFAGSEYAVALANGTVALELALTVLGVGVGDEVVVTPRTFIASASCVVARGATPVFCDIDPVSQNITAESVAAVITPRTKAVICVHLAGWPCDMDPILALAEERGLWIIEDCAQAHGARYKGRPVGSLGHISAWSFCQDKIMTTGGEGGMLTTNRRDLWELAWSIKDHGKHREESRRKGNGELFRWLHQRFGTNLRMTEMQAAIGRIQLTEMAGWHRRRTDNARVLAARFGALEAFRVTVPDEQIDHAYYKYYVFVRPERLKEGWGRDRLVGAIRAEGVPCFVGTCPEIYLERAFQEAGLAPAACLPGARALGETGLMFLVHPTMNGEHMHLIADAVDRVVRSATR